jgi:hypothetical protein
VSHQHLVYLATEVAYNVGSALTYPQQRDREHTRF